MELLAKLESILDFTDLGLALFLGLVGKQSCMINTESSMLQSLEDDLKSISSRLYGLSVATLHCSKRTTLEEFSQGLLVEEDAIDIENGSLISQVPDERFLGSQRRRQRIANVCILRDLQLASKRVQHQALELLRVKHILTNTAVSFVPKPFLLVIISEPSSPPLTTHLRDLIYISHYHDPFSAIEDIEQDMSDADSLSSIIRRPKAESPPSAPIFSLNELEAIQKMSRSVTFSVETMAYLHDIAIFLRTHRAVSGGVSPRATRELELLARFLAILHGFEYVTPSIVALAAPKVYRHRLRIVAPQDERSLQYGSQISAVTKYLEAVSPSSIIEDVLETVEVPV